MNWKHVLRLDIPTALRAGRGPHLNRDNSRSSWKGPRYNGPQRRNTELGQVTALLRAIVRSNAPLVPGLEAAFHDAPSFKMRQLLAALHFDLLRGTTLSEAMDALPRFFPPYYVDLVRAGERTGALPDAFAHLTQHIAEQMAFRRVILQYLAYAGLVTLACLALACFVVTLVLPEFVSIMGDFGISQPRMIERLRWAFDLRANSGWCTLLTYFACTVIALKIAWVATRREPKLRRIAQGAFLRVPVLGNAYMKAQLAHAAAVLGTLLEGGVPLDAALETAAASDVAFVYADVLRRVRKRVLDGASLTQAMATESALPKPFKAFASMGESSGLLPSAFGRLAQLYRRQAQKRARVLLDVLSPATIVAVGVLVCCLTLSVFMFNVALADAIGATL